MCGIVGVAQYASPLPRRLRNKVLRFLFSDIMLSTEVRGRDATGVYQVHRDGEWQLLKKGVKASDWLYLERGKSGVDDEFVYSDVLSSWDEHPSELSAIVGHCRAGTVGAKEEPANNHPHIVQLDERNALMGVHNGTLYNHEIIFKKMPKGLPREGTVDSEAIFHLLYHLTDEGTVPMTAEIIQEVSKRLDGSHSVVVVNSRFPNQIVTFRESRPLEFFLLRPINVVVMASEKKFVEDALARYEFNRRFLDAELPPLTHYDRTLGDRCYRILDTSIAFPSPTASEWATFDRISSEGNTKTIGHIVSAEWKEPVTPIATTTPPATTPASQTVTPPAGALPITPPATTPKGETVVAKAEKAKPATLAAETSTVEIPLEGGVKPEDIYHKAKSLGLFSVYESIKDVAVLLGTEEARLAQMSVQELATILGRQHLAMGYALAQVDNKAEIEEIRSKGRGNHRKLEKLSEKQRRAEAHIWEDRTIIQTMLALHASRFKVDLDNVIRSVKGFPNLSKNRKEDIIAQAKKIFQSPDTHKSIESLAKVYAEAKKRASERKGSEAAQAEGGTSGE